MDRIVKTGLGIESIFNWTKIIINVCDMKENCLYDSLKLECIPIVNILWKGGISSKYFAQPNSIIDNIQQ